MGKGDRFRLSRGAGIGESEEDKMTISELQQRHTKVSYSEAN